MTEETKPWPRAQRMPPAIAGSRAQPWHYQAVAEYDAARGETTEYQSAHRVYTARQVNQAIDWWNERAATVDEHEAPMRRHAEFAAEKIRARVAEDQRVASATTPVPLAGQWRAAQDKHADDDAPLSLIQGRDEYDDTDRAGYSSGNPIIVHAADWQDEAEANLRHIARHDPAHVLARSATVLDVLADLEKIADRSDHPDPRSWARLAICELARMWDLDEATSEHR